MWKLWIVAGLALTVAVLSTGCADEEFRKQQFVASTSEIGFRFLPAKVDIVVVPDNSPSINSGFQAVQASLAGFTNSLQSKFWDFHIAKSPIFFPSPISRVLVHPQFNSPFLPDGTLVTTGGLVPPDRAETNPNNFILLDGTLAVGGDDQTYTNTFNTLSAAKLDTYTNFFRDDALLAVVVVSNGSEFSVDPSHNGVLNFPVLAAHANNLKSLKNNDTRRIRFFSVVAPRQLVGTAGNSCLVNGGTAWPGQSYSSMNNYIPGATYNFCDQSALQNVLGNIEQQLEIERQSYVFSNIVLDEEPVPSTIKVFKGSQELPQGGPNGWEFIGRQTVETITGIGIGTNANACDNSTIQPLVPGLGRRTGYVIKLNGCSRFLGKDPVPNVIFEKN